MPNRPASRQCDVGLLQMDASSVLRLDNVPANTADAGSANSYAVEVTAGSFAWPHTAPLPLDAQPAKRRCCGRAPAPRRGKQPPNGDTEEGVELAPLDSVQVEESGPAAPTLNDINLKIRAGELICIVGQVASGKSSLLQAILGEMEKRTGPSCGNNVVLWLACLRLTTILAGLVQVL